MLHILVLVCFTNEALPNDKMVKEHERLTVIKSSDTEIILSSFLVTSLFALRMDLRISYFWHLYMNNSMYVTLFHCLSDTEEISLT